MAKTEKGHGNVVFVTSVCCVLFKEKLLLGYFVISVFCSFFSKSRDLQYYRNNYFWV